MDDIAANIIDRETALAKFDHARDDFEQAFSQVPDEALGYKPEGVDYTIGYLLTHVRDVITGYSDLVDKIAQARYGEIWLNAPEREINEGPGPEDRAAAIAEMEAAHDRLASQLRDMLHEDYPRQAIVYYPGSEEPYPTSASDILGWVTDHYQEHVSHVKQLLESWERSKA